MPGYLWELNILNVWIFYGCFLSHLFPNQLSQRSWLTHKSQEKILYPPFLPGPAQEQEHGSMLANSVQNSFNPCVTFLLDFKPWNSISKRIYSLHHPAFLCLSPIKKIITIIWSQKKLVRNGLVKKDLGPKFFFREIKLSQKNIDPKIILIQQQCFNPK